jgi:CrcB protein
MEDVTTQPEPLPTDPDVDLHLPAQRTEMRQAARVLAAIAVGGAVGATLRYGIGLAVPATPTGFPWAIFLINVSGCLLIGVLMVLVTQVWPAQRLVRPFFGTGVLGGFTTFSTYVVDIQRLVDAGAAATALTYLAGTLVAALIAVQAGMSATRMALRQWKARS